MTEIWNVQYTLEGGNDAVHCISTGKPWQTRCGKAVPKGTKPLGEFPQGISRCTSCFRYNTRVYFGRDLTSVQKVVLREYIQVELQRFLSKGGLIKRLPPEDEGLPQIIGNHHAFYVNPLRGNDSL